MATPLFLSAEKCTREWFWSWASWNISPLSHTTPTIPQDNLGLTGVLRNTTVWLKNVEALCPVVTAHHKSDHDTKGWDRLPPTSQWFIMAASTSYRGSIRLSMPSSIYRFLNMCNATCLQSECDMKYSGQNLYLPTPFCQYILQGHTLVTPDPGSPIRL